MNVVGKLLIRLGFASFQKMRSQILFAIFALFFASSCSLETKITDVASSLAKPIQVELRSNVPSLTNATSIPVSLVFSEEIADIQSIDLQVSGANISTITGTGKNFEFTITPQIAEHQVGNVQVYFPNQILQLLSTESVKATNSSVLNFTIDRQYPTVVLSSTIAGVTNAVNIPVTVAFSEPVEGLTVDDFVVSGGGASATTLTGSGSQYTLNVVPVLSANITIDLPAQTVRDRAGNGNYAAASLLNITYDIDVPIPALSANVSSPTNASSIEVTVDFGSVNVTGLALSAFQVGNGHVENLSGTGSSYTVQWVPSLTNGTVTLRLPSGVVTNALGSPNLASTTLTIEIDQTPPSVILSGPTPALGHSGSSFLWKAQYTGASGITLSSANVLLSGSASSGCDVAVSGSGSSERSIEVSGCASEGSLSVQLQAGTAVDAAGNLTEASAVSSSATVDNTRPSLTVTGPLPAVGNSSAVFEWTLTYADFSTIDLNTSHVSLAPAAGVTSCSVSTTTAGANTRKVRVQGCQGNGDVGIQIAAETATNSLGLKAAGVSSADLAIVDNAPPLVSIGNVTPAIGNSSTQFEWTVSYTDVNTVLLTSSFVSLAGTSVNADCVINIIDTADAFQKKVRVTGCSQNGSLGISLAAGSARDLAGNLAASATTSSAATVDNNAFTGLLATTVTSPTNLSVIPVTVTFNSEPSSFTSAHLSVQNGSVSNFAGDGLSYSFDLQPSADGDLSVQILAATLQNEVGNPNEASNNLLVHVDRVAPTMVISGPTPGIGNRTAVFVWEVAYTGADIISLDADDIILSGSAANSCGTPVVATTGTGTRSVTLGGCQETAGEVSIQVAAQSAQDNAGNQAALSVVSTAAIVDNTPPSLTLQGPLIEDGGVLVGNSDKKFVWEVSYSGQSNITLASGDVTVVTTGSVSGCTKTVSSSGVNSRYISLTNCSGDGSASISIAEGTGVDSVGNLAEAAVASGAATVDNTKPLLAVTGPEPAAGNINTAFSWTLDYSEHLTVSLEESNISKVFTGTATGCSVNVYTINASRRVVELTDCSGDGSVKIQVAAGTSVDEAGNLAAANATSIAAVVDNTGPTLAITRTGSSYGNVSSTFQWTLDFTDADSIGTPEISLNGTATAGCTSEVTGSGNTQRLVSVIGCTGNGTLGISVAAGSAQDVHGNPSGAATSSSVNVDNVAPVLTIGSSVPSIGNSTATFTWNLSYTDAETVVLLPANIQLLGATSGCSTPDVVTLEGGDYQVTTTGCTGNGNLRIQVASGTASDAAGNVTGSVTGPNALVDNVAPNITFHGSTFYLHGERVAVWIGAYSSTNTVSHVSETTLLLQATGTAECTNVSRQAFPGTISLSVSSCSGDGEVRWKAVEGAIVDLAGNKSAEVISHVAYVDNTPPEVTIESPLPNSQAAGLDSSNVQFSGTCSDEGMTLPTTPAAKASVVCTGGSWNAEVDYSATTTEELSLTINAKDLAGHEDEDSVTFLRPTYKVKSIHASSNAFVALRADGSVVSWGGTAGLPPASIREKDGKVKKIVGNDGAFVALLSTGDIVTWGDPLKGGDAGSFTGYVAGSAVDIYAGTDTLAVETAVGKVAVWGHPDRGSLSDASAVTFAEVLSGYRAYAARTHSGGVMVWGDPNYGGNASEVSALLTRVKSLAATRTGAFAALKLNGTVVAWGNIGTSGNRAPASVTTAGSDVKAVVGNDAAFAALKANGSVVAWGSATGGGDTSLVSSALSSGVKSLVAGKDTFAAIKADGKVITWGNLVGSATPTDLSLASGMSYAASVTINTGAFAALTGTGQVLAWGDPLAGGNLGAQAGNVVSGVKQIFKTERAFAALKADGSVVTWGDANFGGDSSAVATELTSKVIEISATNSAFAALKSDGKVVTWGQASAGGDSSLVAHKLAGVLNAVKDLESASSGFYALKADGSVTSWGGMNREYISGDISSGVVDVIQNGDGDDGIALKDDGTLVGWYPWKSTWTEQDIPSSVTTPGANVKKVFNGTYMPYAAALKTDGSVVVWGYFGHGEPRPAPSSVTAANSQVIDIVTNGSSRAALKADGTVRAWNYIEDDVGDYAGLYRDFGGTPPASVTASGANVIKVVASYAAFAALKADGSVVCWGSTIYGGSGCEAVQPMNSRVVDIVPGNQGFVAMLANGTVKSWGDPGALPAGYDVEGTVRKVVAYDGGYLGLDYDGVTTYWGRLNGQCTAFCPRSKDIKSDGMFGMFGNAYAISYTGQLNLYLESYTGPITYSSEVTAAMGLQSVTGSGGIYSMLYGNGQMLYWSEVSATVEARVSSVTSVKMNWSSFAALRGDGSVQAFGDASYGGELLDDLKD